MHRATGELLKNAVEVVNAVPLARAAIQAVPYGASIHTFNPHQEISEGPEEAGIFEQEWQQPASTEASLEAEAEARLRRVVDEAVQAEVDAKARALHDGAGHAAALAAQAVAVGEPLASVAAEADRRAYPLL